jgi:hypothetical protein
MKIVAMATHTTRELERRVRRQGILFYMTKPVARELLQGLLDHLMKSDRTGPVHGRGS